MEWIIVNDALPGYPGRYIVACKEYGAYPRVTTALYLVKSQRFEMTGYRSHWKITHWMAFPEPPSKQIKMCVNCEYCGWDKRDKPCCYCIDHSMFEECEE